MKYSFTHSSIHQNIEQGIFKIIIDPGGGGGDGGDGVGTLTDGFKLMMLWRKYCGELWKLCLFI